MRLVSDDTLNATLATLAANRRKEENRIEEQRRSQLRTKRELLEQGRFVPRCDCRECIRAILQELEPSPARCLQRGPK